jgi:hypothetical protein
MKIKDAAKYLHLVQALADGETLQQIVNKTWQSFYKDEEISFSNPPERYRIKPKLMEFYAIANEDKTECLNYRPETREEAEKHIRDLKMEIYTTIVHMREVE